MNFHTDKNRKDWNAQDVKEKSNRITFILSFRHKYPSRLNRSLNL
jgi:hypothetical protein